MSLERVWEWGPLEGWVIRFRDIVGIVRGCEHPLPRLYYVPRLIGGTKVRVGPVDLCRVVPCSPSPCVRGLRAPLASLEEAMLVDPVEAVRGLSGCWRAICRAALGLVEELVSAGLDLVGVTGSLVYGPVRARDIDLVVYGDPDRAYDVLQRLRRDGVTSPLHHVHDGSWRPGDHLLHRLVSPEKRLLFGVYAGFEYSIRLVPCTKPLPCRRGRVAGRARVEAVLRPLSPHTSPAYYLAETGRGTLLVYTLRLRYTELPRGARVRVEGVVEEYCGLKILVPDHGYMEPLPERGSS